MCDLDCCAADHCLCLFRRQCETNDNAQISNTYCCDCLQRCLLTSAAVPEARAGILGFLHRHLFGGSSAQRNRSQQRFPSPIDVSNSCCHSKTGSAGHTKKAARSQRALSEQRLTMRRFPMPAPQLNFGQQARAYPSFAARSRHRVLRFP